jgi:nicotinate-nucleotide adenylyltransferase
MKIAVFGGTFDPPHIGHRSYYELESANFDKFIIVPTGDPPHKELRPDSASAEQRCEMAKLTFPECEISDIEIRRSGKSYTSDTVRELLRLYPGAEFTLLMGTDMFNSLPKWYEYDWLKENVSFKCLDRGVIPISSSGLRTLLTQRKGREFLIPNVYAYIVKHRLYGVAPDFEWLWQQTENWMEGRRVTHVRGTEKAAVSLAEHYGADIDEARTAAILHDITKLKNREQHLTYLRVYGIIPGVQDISDKLLHAITGAEIAYRELGVSEAVYSAIRWHTTGRANMTRLEEVLYLADFIEENRRFDGADAVRQIAYHGINKAMELALSIAIAEIKEAGSVLHPASEEAYNYYVCLNGASK